MQIGIMTFLHNDNYGSTLQAWALQKTLRELGHEAEHIDYRPSRQEKIRNLLASGNSPKLVLEGLRKRAVKASEAGARSKSASFSAFYQSEMRMSPPCADHAALCRQADKYDALLCGSDQIWSPVWLNPAYFLDFSPGKPKAAYAASLGVSQLPSQRKARRMKRMTADFIAVSLREEEGAAIMERITGQRWPVMPDPVWLQTRAAWQALAQRPKQEEPYLLCYFIGDNDDYWRCAADLAGRTGLRVVVVPVTQSAYRQPYTLADGLSPQEWLGYLDGAAHIMTDSFHGTAFAALLGKPFTVLRRYREDDPESKNSRIDQLMRTLSLNDTAEIPWPQVEERLSAMRRQGRDWLEAAVERMARQAAR